METLEQWLVKELTKRNATITTAESCTGGLISGRIVNASGASGVFHQSFVTYSNEAKKSLLGVKKETLDTVGAVSEETARQMAVGAAKAAKADVALSATGIAGPGWWNRRKTGWPGLSRLLLYGKHLRGTTCF